MSTLQHVIFPTDGDSRSITLYLDTPERYRPVAETAEEGEGRDEDTRIGAEEDAPEFPELLDLVRDRSSLALPAGTTTSLAAYFNAFPAGYWSRWTTVRTVRLLARIEGECRVRLMASNRNGMIREIGSREIRDGELSIDASLAGFDPGGWLWFDVTALSDAVISGARWVDAQEHDGEQVAVGQGLVTLAMTTMNKPDFATATLARVASDEGLMGMVETIVVVDQGTDTVREHADYPAVAQALGDRLLLVEQANLGGSGGFSRGMYEALKNERSDYVMLLDDDVEVDPESVSRGIRVARRSSRPLIVGGHMLDINHPSVLHAMAERIDQYNLLWGATPGTRGRHNFARTSLRQTRWLHRRYDADFNGWWMCLIPLSVVRELGLATPMFLKWDDAEFGLRAKEVGVPTVSFPGYALWHVSWLDKDDGIDWQAYFHQRNRLITALLHAKRRRGGWLLSDSIRVDIRHLVTMEYYAASLRHLAMRDVLDGPEGLRGLLAGRVGDVRARAADFPEAARRSPEDVPDAPVYDRGKPRDGWPKGIGMLWFGARYLLRAVLRPVDPDAQERPKIRLAPRFGTWWRVPRYDSVLVSTADRQALFWYRRDRRKVLALLRDSLALHWRIVRDWDALSRQYRSAMPDEVSPRAWAQTFGIEPDEPGSR